MAAQPLQHESNIPSPAHGVQQGPQVDANLQRSIQAASDAAQRQVSHISTYVAQLSVALPRPVATLPRDLQPVDSQSAVYKELSAVMATVSKPVRSISRVNAPDREARFNAWRASLPAHLQHVSRVSICQWILVRLPMHANVNFFLYI